MDGGERRQSQYGASYQPSGGGHPAPGQSMGPSSQQQYSQTAPSPSRTDLGTQPTARTYMPGYHYGYQEPQFQTPQMHSSSPLQGVHMQYNPSYVQDPSRSHQLQSPPSQQQYATYVQGSMLPPVGQQSMYGNIPQYQHERQSTALEVMTGQFGSLPQYMPQADSSGVSVGHASSQYLSSQPEQQTYGPISASRPHLQPPFAPSTADYSVLEQPMQTQSQEDKTTRQVTEEGRRQYEQQLRATFNAISAGRVSEASEKLITVTEWLLGSVRALGLHHDDEENHDQRLLLWRELNHAWEALGQKQKTITEEAARTRRQPRDILSSAAIIALVDKLVQLCDQIEKYGLVDYEIGIWEEQIVGIFTQCLDLLPHEQARGGGSLNQQR
ncbi:hypothetical protein H2198_002390 [Neophaeococcomyces mojaviensis]|uniref:Uncharacterized protein n=1 Tax=Neophaeococcomyces mojaviensis TaxID=3383035 RepID=A0ACC3AET5_9EURO|nr:hypothetical protein H2198_002390 [Knufia sp. JES_112]